MDDVVVVELRGQLRFIDEHLDEVLVVGKVRQDLLDGDDLLKSFHAAHARLPDFGHSAGGDLFEQDVLAELDAVGRLFFLRHAAAGTAAGKTGCEIGIRSSFGIVNANGFGGERRRRAAAAELRTRRGGAAAWGRRGDGRRRSRSGRRDAAARSSRGRRACPGNACRASDGWAAASAAGCGAERRGGAGAAEAASAPAAASVCSLRLLLRHHAGERVGQHLVDDRPLGFIGFLAAFDAALSSSSSSPKISLEVSWPSSRPERWPCGR